MVLIILAVSLTPLTLITGLMGYYFETSYRDKVMENLQELVEKDQQRINVFLAERLGDVEFLADSYSYDELTGEAFLQHRLLVLQRAYPGVFVDLGVVNSAGVQISYAGNLKLLNADYSKARWFQDAMKNDHYLSDVFLGLRRQPHFIICVRKRRGDSDWVLRATVNFTTFNSLVEEIHIGKTGSAFIANAVGELQSRPRTELIPNIAGLLRVTPWTRGGAMAGAEPVAPHAPEVTMISSDPSAVTGVVRSRGPGIIFILTPLKSGEWTLVYQQDRDDAFSEIKHARTITLAIFFFGCLTILLVTLLVSRTMVRRIERADFEKEMMNQQVIEAGKLASIGELAAGVAHEINNPVAIMVEEAGWMEDLLEEAPPQSPHIEEFRHALRQINLQGVRCKEITHKLLSFARPTDVVGVLAAIMGVGDRPVRRKLQINETLKEVLSIYEQRAKSDNIQIRTELDRGLPPVSASPTEMQQVFMNLINNALDAMGSAGGSLEVRTRMEGGEVVVDIADTGPGIPKAAIARIFDPFFTTKPAGKGTGLGLSICYGIIKKLGGKLTVDSAVGLGATFHVHIPVRTETP